MAAAKFSTAPGASQSGYRIFKGTRKDSSPYHIKCHPLGELDAFEEYHVVFESLDKGATRPKAYYYFDVPMVLVTAKSGKDAALIAEAKAIAKVFSGKLDLISDPDLAAMRAAAKEQATKVAENKAREDAARANTTKEDRVQAANAGLAAKSNESGKYIPPSQRQATPSTTAPTAKPPAPQPAKPSAPQTAKSATPQPAKPWAKPAPQQAAKPTTQQPAKPMTQQATKPSAPQTAKPATPQPAKPWAKPAPQQGAKPTTQQPGKSTTQPATKPWTKQPAKPGQQ